MQKKSSLDRRGIVTKEIDRLEKILDEDERQKIYPCIRDILCNGIDPERFKSEGSLPTRQDVSRFILEWLKEIGVSPDRCQNWVIGYATRVLSGISSSSKSRIRHSTKSLIKFIYGSDQVSFSCGCEQNGLKAACDPHCPLYDEMQSRKREDQLRRARPLVRPVVQVFSEPSLSVKERYKEQFDKAMVFVKDQLNQVSTLDELKQVLNDQGFKTRTGKPWTTATLYNEIRAHQLSFTAKDSQINGVYQSIKDQYQKQYHDAVSLIAKMNSEGFRINEILAALEAEQYKTITGRQWTVANIRNKISEINKNKP